jgi:hypothetical protein
MVRKFAAYTSGENDVMQFIATEGDLDIYVDGTGGDDDNDGLTRATALKTYRGLVKRVAMNRQFGAKLRVWFAGGDADLDDRWDAPTSKITYDVDYIGGWGSTGDPTTDSPVFRGPQMMRVSGTTSYTADENVLETSETFRGSGLNDLTPGGTFTAPYGVTVYYRVKIDGTGTPDTFQWSDNGGDTWNASTVGITGAAQTLSNGVTVTFGATTGHTSGDFWDFMGIVVGKNIVGEVSKRTGTTNFYGAARFSDGKARTLLAFTTAAPGWTADAYQGKFLRIKRGSDLVYAELPIAKNDTNLIVIDRPDIAHHFKYVNPVTFSGSGLDDATSGGECTLTDRAASYVVKIDGTGTPDTFKWSDDGGSTWEATGVSITGSAQTLNNDVTVTFAATTGHTLNDEWSFKTGLILEPTDTFEIVEPAVQFKGTKTFTGFTGLRIVVIDMLGSILPLTLDSYNSQNANFERIELVNPFSRGFMAFDRCYFTPSIDADVKSQFFNGMYTFKNCSSALGISFIHTVAGEPWFVCRPDSATSPIHVAGDYYIDLMIANTSVNVGANFEIQGGQHEFRTAFSVYCPHDEGAVIVESGAVLGFGRNCYAHGSNSAGPGMAVRFGGLLRVTGGEQTQIIGSTDDLTVSSASADYGTAATQFEASGDWNGTMHTIHYDSGTMVAGYSGVIIRS